MVRSIGKTENTIKVNSFKTKDLAKVFSPGKMVASMMVSGRMENNMVRALSTRKMVKNLRKVDGRTERMLPSRKKNEIRNTM